MEAGPPNRLRHRPRRALFALPSAMTLAGLACGAWACARVGGSNGPALAAWAVFAAMLFDLFDGRVARLTRTQSEFGTQLDSLADMVSFGVAPGLILHRTLEGSLGPVAGLLGFSYVACAALRLARFNVLARGGAAASDVFLGLPTPLAAGTVVALTLGWPSLGAVHAWGTATWVGVAVALSVLMVSTIQYRTFKRMDPANIMVALGLLGLAAASAVPTTPKTALLVAVGGYVVLGPMEALFRLVQGGRRVPQTASRRAGR
ncbi:MAG TPA: CDP-diacylglycerol--serine O-phosphatidyltransferase [Myxococcales bacterium LLY-WYZ-16_1]|nr:CDP-diacylglycerol--serine O-phosphatidyltransferase [Myxococcales bacterium LLY-WYZ-16_1]